MKKSAYLRPLGVLGLLTLMLGFIFSLQTEAGVMDQYVYFPITISPGDVQIAGFIITQAVQDPLNEVALVANRPTLLRVFTTTEDGQDHPQVSVTITAYRDGVEIGSRVIGPQTASSNSTRDDLNSTFNLILPVNWLSGDVLLIATAGGESQGQITAAFQVVPDLNLRIVPIRYTHTPNGQTYTTPTSDTISDWILRTYPVAEINVSFHAQYPFVGNLQEGNGWNQLLPEIRTLKLSSGGPADQVFYGLIPADWFSGGIAGYGYIGQRASIGLNLFGGWWGADTAGELAAHEIGHNFGRYHVDCGGAGGIDPQYPYNPSTIGQFGVDGIGEIELDLISPTGAKDFMGYCDPVWVSDYTYEALLMNQLAVASKVLSAPEEQLIISGSVKGDGNVDIDPIYILPVATENSGEASSYVIELVAADGSLLSVHAANVITAGEHDISGEWVFANIPVPQEEIAAVRLRDTAIDVVVGARELWSTTGMALQPQLQQNGDTAVLHWGPTDQPALIRYSADDGESWQVLALDVLDGTFNVDLRQLPGGENAFFEIIPANTTVPQRMMLPLNTALPNQAPQVWITGPAQMTQGELVILYGFGSDAEDGPLTDLTWGLNGQRLAADRWLAVEDLPSGTYPIMLQGTDSDGETVVVFHELTVSMPNIEP